MCCKIASVCPIYVIAEVEMADAVLHLSNCGNIDVLQVPAAIMEEADFEGSILVQLRLDCSFTPCNIDIVIAC